MEAPPTNGYHVAAAESLEREVLGACMVDTAACAQAIQMLEPNYLHDRQHKHPEIFETIRTLFSEGSPVNLSTVTQAGHDGMYLSDLIVRVASTANVEHHALIITEKWIERQAHDELRRAVARIRGGEDIFQILEDLQRHLSGIVVGRKRETHIREAVKRALERVQEWRAGEVTDFAPSGFYTVDRKFGGFPVGELVTIAAQTGAGKTSIMTQIIGAQGLREINLSQPRAVLMFSAEMTAEQIVHRMASNWSQADLTVIRAGKASDEAYETYDKNLARIGKLSIHVDDEPSPTFSHIAARCQQVLLTDGLCFVGVDYDEKISGEGDTEELRVSAIAQGLKNLAKRFEVPVVTLSQYSRKAEGYYGVPSDGWLRYSGMKQHESAMILHWYWPGFWVHTKGVSPRAVEAYDENYPNLGFLLCTKNRFGATGKVEMDFIPQTTRFIDHGEPAADARARANNHRQMKAPF